MSNLAYGLSIGICGMLAVVAGVTYGTLLPKDSSQNTKLLAIVTVFSFVASLIAYALALYHFSHNPGQMAQFILGIVMLIVLPCTLISASISTITISNLRDTLATGGH
jgi:ACR3 family arsenite efflux pump ArsB